MPVILHYDHSLRWVSGVAYRQPSGSSGAVGHRIRSQFSYREFGRGSWMVKMHGAAGYGPSFLEEAFGGLIRKE